MQLKSFEYCEHIGNPKEWVLRPFTLGQINLLVGRNASGKSRIISVLSGLPKLITGELKELFESGSFDVVLEHNGDEFSYQLNLKGRAVESESFSKSGKLLYTRDSDGKGAIWSEKLDVMLDFEIPSNALVIHSKRDKVQHGYLEPIHEWASSVRLCLFGTSLGREKLQSFSDLTTKSSKEIELLNPNEIHELYLTGFTRFGEAFDQAIINDLKTMGYETEDVGLEPIGIPQFKGVPFATLFVKERDLAASTTQLTMSQGMFRAFALAIQLAWCEFTKLPRTILIDDVGEGLDFERSKALVKLLVDKAQLNKFQLVMTTNDRFVMNGADLKYWGVVQRRGTIVEVINEHSRPNVFEEFEILGLNNFDFFSTRFFETGLVE